MSTTDLSQALAATPLFREMTAKEVKQVAKHLRVVNHRAGDVITTQGRNGAGFHLVLDGEAVVETKQGDVVLRGGDYFGEISLIDGLPRTATVRAKTDITTAVLSPWDFSPLLKEHPTMAMALLRGLCAHIRSRG